MGTDGRIVGESPPVPVHCLNRFDSNRLTLSDAEILGAAKNALVM